jgi:Flp pilus assembly protein TadD
VSAINRMLLDLDRRHGLAHDALPAPVRPVHESHARGLPLGWLALGMLLLAGIWAGLHAWQDLPRSAPRTTPIAAIPNLPETAAIAPQPEATDIVAPEIPVEPELALDYQLALVAAHTPPAVRPQTATAKVDAPAALASPSSSPLAAKASAPASLETLLAQARAARRDQRHHDALRAWQAALATRPEQREALRGMAQTWLDLDRADQAEIWLEKIHAAQPGDAWSALLLARMHAEQGRLDAAFATLKSCFEHGAHDAELHGLAGAIEARREHHTQAVEHYRQALASYPANGVWLLGLGLSLDVLGQPDEARHALRRALESGTLSAKLEAFVTQKLAPTRLTGR